MAGTLIHPLIIACLGILLAGCGADRDQQTRKVLVVPERTAQTYELDQLRVAGQDLSLWYEDGGCKLQVVAKGKPQGEKRWLKPTAPCYFVKSPGTQRVQVYQRDKTTRVVALVGTPVASKKPGGRCGRELQGLIVRGNGTVDLSENIQSGSVYCADQGLDNFQYSLFK